MLLTKKYFYILLLTFGFQNFSLADPFDAFKDIADGIDKAVQGDKDAKKKDKKDKKKEDQGDNSNASASSGDCGNLAYLLEPQYKTQSSSSMVEVFDKITNEFKYEKPEDVVNNLTKKNYRCDSWTVCYDTFNNEFNSMPVLYKLYTNYKQGNCPGTLTSEELSTLSGLNKGKMTGLFDDLTVYVNKYKEKEEIKIANQIKQDFNNSPEGLTQQLETSYYAYMLAKFAHDVRKDYQVKYVTNQVMNDVKKSMKIIEEHVKKNVPNIDTDALWDKASKQYINDFGQIEELHKADPQKYLKDFHNAVTLTVTTLNQEANKITGGSKNKPKKDF